MGITLLGYFVSVKEPDNKRVLTLIFSNNMFSLVTGIIDTDGYKVIYESPKISKIMLYITNSNLIEVDKQGKPLKYTIL